MKKIIAFLLCSIMLVALVSCGNTSGGNKDFDINSVKTVGEVLKLEIDGYMSDENESKFVYVFKYKGTTYRIYADITVEIFNKMQELDFLADDYDEKLLAIIGDVKVTQAEDMTKYIPTEEELKKYVGKTGQELLDDDFWTSGYSLMGEQVFWMGHDLYEFSVYFNEDVPDDFDWDNLSEEDAIMNMTVKKIEFDDFSMAVTDLE